MLIVIPSSGRATRQTTLRSLPKSIREKVVLCVYPSEAVSYKINNTEMLIVPESISGIAQKRQWLLEEATRMGEPRVVMLDDDLVFATRRKDDPTKFHTSTDAEVEKMFSDIYGLLVEYPLVGVSGREGANRKTDEYIENTRLMRVLAYRADIFRKEGIKASDGDVMCDFHATLALLTHGYSVININWIVQNQHGSDTSGGCSTYRTSERQTAAAEALKAAFPDFVQVVQKETKTAWGGKPRTDVIISWKKAHAEGQRKADLPHFGHSHES